MYYKGSNTVLEKGVKSVENQEDLYNSPAEPFFIFVSIAKID